jgi:hypothetical protein
MSFETEDYFREFGKFHRLFVKESDRAAAVLAAIFLDLILKQALLEKFVKHRSTEKWVFDQGALRNFGPKIDIAFALGLLNETARNDLVLINEVRNYFAHKELGAASFGAEKPRQLCERLSIVKWLKREGRYDVNPQARDPRRQYMSQVAQVVFHLGKIDKVQEYLG